MPRLATIAMSSALALLAFAPAAQAGTYDVLSCDAAPDAVNHSWFSETNDSAHIEFLASCPSSRTYSGLAGRTILDSGASPTGSFGQWIFRAPTGTRISRIRLVRMLGMEGGSGWRLFGRQADGTTLSGETCTVPATADECNVGGYGTTEIDKAVDTTSIAYGFECNGDGSCTTGATIHSARAAIYSGRVTITDPTAPLIDSPSGQLVTESGYHRGTESATVNGSDGTGLKALRVYIDKIERANQALSCNYTKPIPCSNPSSAQALSVDLSATVDGARVIPDGTHSVEVAAIDAAGNETRSTARSIVVDATAPAAPSALATSIGSTWQPARQFTATWTHPSGQIAPIDTAHWTLCPAGNTTGCVTGSSPVSSVSGTLSGLQVPAEGAWDLSLRLEDAAGNTAARNFARTTIRYDATPPGTTPDLALADRNDTDSELTASFSLPSGQHAPVTEALWNLCPDSSSTGCTSGMLSTDVAPTTYLRTTVPTHGDWILSIRLRDQAGNLGAAATTSLRYAKTPATQDATPVPTPPSTPTPATASNPAPDPAPRANARLRVASAVFDRSRRTLIVRGTAASTATGAIRVRAAIRRDRRTRTRAKTVALRSGRFTARLRLTRADAQGRITLTAGYAGSTTHAPARTPKRSVRVQR